MRANGHVRRQNSMMAEAHADLSASTQLRQVAHERSRERQSSRLDARLAQMRRDRSSSSENEGEEAEDETESEESPPRSKRNGSHMERLVDDIATAHHVRAAFSPAIDIVLPGHTSESEAESSYESDHEAHWHATRPLWVEYATSSDESVLSFADIWGAPDEIPSGHGTNNTSNACSAASTSDGEEALPDVTPSHRAAEAVRQRASAPPRALPRPLPRTHCAACFHARYPDAPYAAPAVRAAEGAAVGERSYGAGANPLAALCAEVHALSGALVGTWGTIEAQIGLALRAAGAARAHGCRRCTVEGGRSVPVAAAATPSASSSGATDAKSVSPGATARVATRRRARRRPRVTR